MRHRRISLRGAARAFQADLNVRLSEAIAPEHLIKLQALPATGPRNGWGSIDRARGPIDRDMKDSPSLRRLGAEMIVDDTPRAATLAALSLARFSEQLRVKVGSLTFTEDQVLGDWFPDRTPAPVIPKGRASQAV